MNGKIKNINNYIVEKLKINKKTEDEGDVTFDGGVKPDEFTDLVIEILNDYDIINNSNYKIFIMSSNEVPVTNPQHYVRIRLYAADNKYNIVKDAREEIKNMCDELTGSNKYSVNGYIIDDVHVSSLMYDSDGKPYVYIPFKFIK